MKENAAQKATVESRARAHFLSGLQKFRFRVLLIIAMVLQFGSGFCAEAQLLFTNDAEGICITGYLGTGNMIEVNIPSTINGVPVEAVS
jgi:hypothetical protein